MISCYKDKTVNIHETIDIIITLLEARDPYTFSHSWRVAELSVMIAEAMELDESMIEKLHVAAHLHDIGKIGVPDKILNKPGRFTDEERKHMQAHPRIGYNILNRIPIFKEISDTVLYHHERYDGMGYPSGLTGDDIPLPSRIICVADAFDAITSDRPYRKGASYIDALEEIKKHSGNQFCPFVVEYFESIIEKVPFELEKIERVTIEHFAFVEHEDLMHSRRLI